MPKEQNQKNWLWQLQNSITTPEQLFKHFNFSAKEQKEIFERLSHTRFSITPYLLSLMQKERACDPIWLQYGPSKMEGELLEEKTSWEKPEEMFANGMGQHKYPDKVVIRVAHHCAAYCRFCFERARTLENSKIANLNLAREQAVAYVKNNKQIREVILTGGDPFALTDKVLEGWIEQFRGIKTVDSIRIHTRMPLQNPYRITVELAKMLKAQGVRWINVHVNHPVELTEDFFQHIRLLHNHGIIIKTQNPILRNINDNPETLAKLVKLCRKHGIQHHHWDHAMEVTPFAMRTSVERVILIFKKLQKVLGNIRWNPSELGDLIISNHDGKRTIPFEEIEIDLKKPRESWGTKTFQFTTKDDQPIIRFTSWRPERIIWNEYFDPRVDLNDLKQSDFHDML